MSASDTSACAMSLEKFCALQSTLLALERAAELSQSEALLSGLSVKELAARGLGLHGLIIEGQRTGLYGRTIVTLTPRIRGIELPAHCISNGDIIGLSAASDPSSQIASGVVTSVASTSIDVSFDETNEYFSIDDSFKIVKLANDITYKRLKKALSSLTDNVMGISLLKNSLFGLSTFGPPLQSLPSSILDKEGQIRFVNSNLDASQREAVRFALLQRELAIIHGPPGTGKTTTVVEVITQAVRTGNKILCCAPSNIAVDNLLDRLVKNKVRAVRLGHPARVHQGLQQYSLDALIGSSDQTKIVQDVRQDIDKAIAKLKRSRSKAERGGLSKDLKDLRKELREREQKAMKEILQHADVVLSTLTSGSPDGPLKHLPSNHFDMTIIDECSQSLELACWIVLPFASKTILAGDHLQLPPTIISDEAARKGFALTLMERAVKYPDVVRMLKIQYRMNIKIMEWASKAFYDGQLEAHHSVEKHLLCDLEGVTADENTNIPLLLIDTTGCDMYELETSDEISKANEGEVGLVCIHVEHLIESGVQPGDIAVITPYNLQVELIRHQLCTKYPGLEIRSVDGFQGREKEAVVLSLVRSNRTGEVGFLAESRRLNVAVTRGRRHVAVVCSVETVSQNPVLKVFMEYLEEHGEVRTAMQYQHELEKKDIFRPEEMVLNIKDKEKSYKNVTKRINNKKEKKPVHAGKDKIIHLKKQEAMSKKDDVALEIKNEDSLANMEEANKQKRIKFEGIIQKFQTSNKSAYEFSPDLSSHDRLTVHEIAEQLQLIHESVGEGKQRYIILRKSGCLTAKASENDDELILEEDSEQASSVEVKSVKCATCQSMVPKVNMDLHKLRCKAPNVGDLVKPPTSVFKEAETKKHKHKKLTKKHVLGNNEEENFETLLETFAKIDNICNFEKCKAKISLLGVNCEFCNVRFCLGHSMPEIHGCGDEARKAARKQISRDGKLYPGSGRPDFKLDPVKKKQLQSKLDKKINSLGEDRKVKKKEK